jgi:quinoprotein glucose dehydrogenase
MPLGAPNNDRVGTDRPGNNLFSSSVVAVDANTGKYLWHFQLVHHDVWDYDTQSAPLVVDLIRNGTTVPALIMVNKTGLVFTLNRVTGKPIFDVVERPVPKSDVPGEQASPTQPFPVKPEPLTQMTISRDHLYKGEPQHQSYCERMVDDNHIKLGGPYMPIALNGYSISPPGPQGGINFWGGSYDPKLRLFVSNTTNLFQPMRLVQKPDGSYINEGPLAGLRRFGDADRHLPCGPTPWGELVAVNMDTGDIARRLASPTHFRRVFRTRAGRAPAASSSPRAASPLLAARMISASARLRPRQARSSGRPSFRHRSRRHPSPIWARTGGSS